MGVSAGEAGDGGREGEREGGREETVLKEKSKLTVAELCTSGNHAAVFYPSEAVHSY